MTRSACLGLLLGGLAACSTPTPAPAPAPAPASTPGPASTPAATPAATPAPAANAGILNPVDAEGRHVLKGADGDCYVAVPRPAHRGPPPPGAPPGRAKTACSGILTSRLPAGCTDALVERSAKGTCTCAAQIGDPPPVTPAACPPWP